MESLRRFGWIPSSKLAIPLVALRHAGRDGSASRYRDALELAALSMRLTPAPALTMIPRSTPVPTDISQYWGPSAWDAPNRFSMTESYQVPGPHRGSGWLRRVANGWELSSSTILQAGLPYTVFTNAPFEPIFDAQGNVVGVEPGSGDYNADGFNFDFPDAPAGGYQTATTRQAYLSGVFTSADFGVPHLGTEGNEQYNRFRRPGFAETDFALIKDTQIVERFHLQLRFEFYNLFNRPNKTGVDSNLPDSTFGKSTSQYNPRWVQFRANLMF